MWRWLGLFDPWMIPFNATHLMDWLRYLCLKRQYRQSRSSSSFGEGGVVRIPGGSCKGWNGNRVTEKEVLRELDLLQAAGIGGVEINPIALYDQADAQSVAPVERLGEKWNRLLRATVERVRDEG